MSIFQPEELVQEYTRLQNRNPALDSPAVAPLLNNYARALETAMWLADALMVVGNMQEVLEAAHNTMVFDPRDWAAGERDAWLYGIFVGWDDAVSEVKQKYDWNDETVERMERMHRSVLEAQEFIEPEET